MLAAACNKALHDGDYIQAVGLANQALKTSSGDRKAHLCLGRALGGKGDHNGAITALQAGDKLSTNALEHSVALTLLGNQYASVRAYTEATEAYRASLAAARADKNQHFVRINLNQLGEVQQAAGDNAGALEYYLQGQRLAANDNERGEGNACIAATYSLLGNHDKAIEYQIKSLLEEERVGELDQYANAGVEMGRIYLVAGQYENAEKVLNKIFAVITLNNDAYWEAKIYLTLGKLRSAQGKPAEANDFYQRGKLLADKARAEDLSKEISAAMVGSGAR